MNFFKELLKDIKVNHNDKIKLLKKEKLLFFDLKNQYKHFEYKNKLYNFFKPKSKPNKYINHNQDFIKEEQK